MTLFSLPLSVMFSPITTIGQFHLREFRSLRFTAKELRSGDSWPEIRSSGLTRFGVLYRNCSVSEESVSQSDGATEYLHFADKVAFDGWFLVTGRGAATSDAVKFVLEGSNDNTTWTTVAISSECGSWSADKPAPEHHILPVFPMPTARERVVWFNFLRNECLFPDVIYVITQWIMTLVLICASLAAFMGAYREAPKHVVGLGCESFSLSLSLSLSLALARSRSCSRPLSLSLSLSLSLLRSLALALALSLACARSLSLALSLSLSLCFSLSVSLSMCIALSLSIWR